MSNSTYKVDLETAEAELERFAEEMDLDLDKSDMDGDDLKSYESVKKVVIRSIRKGNLVINDDGEPEFTPVKGNLGTLVFKEPEGSNFQAMDRAKANEDFKKLNSLIAELVGKSAGEIGSLKQRDYKVVQALLMLFLG